MVFKTIISLILGFIGFTQFYPLGKMYMPTLVATVGQLLFAPWAWAYSILHPLGVGK